MSRLIEMLKINMKLLLRNKGFLFFLLVTPIVSVIIMTIRTDSSFYEESGGQYGAIREITDSDKVAYLNDWSKYSVKVLDGAYSPLSEYVLQQMAGDGMFAIYRLDASDMTEEEILEQAQQDGFNDRIGTILYVKPGFDEAVLKGSWEEAVQFYRVSEDERWELWETSITGELAAVRQAARAAGAAGDTPNPQDILAVLNELRGQLPDKQVITLEGQDELALTREQNEQKNLSGYAYAIITLGFLFCGVCVAYTVIEERNHKVYTRIMLSDMGRYQYLLSKLMVSLLVSLLQTVVLAVCIFVVRDADFGIPKLSFLLFVWLLGLIFNILSMAVGILMGDVMGANYAVFAIWTVSALFAGLYFPIDDSAAVMKCISQFMPQRWFMRAQELLMVGDTSAYPMVLCVTLAYLLIIVSVGVVGLKMKESEA